jgi:HAD superfamily hydrolase (TIGR01549 family)
MTTAGTLPSLSPTRPYNCLVSKPYKGAHAVTGSVGAVLFDLDDTLFDHQQCARAALGAIRDLHPSFSGMEPARFEQSHSQILETLHLEVLAGRLPLDAARVERFRRLYSAAGVEAGPEMSEQAAVVYRDRYIASRTEVKGATALLEALRHRARVVIVSNNLLAEQQAKLRHCGLDRHIDALVVSEEAGVSKPDPGIFEIALRRADVTASEAVMVGDSWTNDIEGARAVGIRAVWFNRDGRAAPDPGVQTITSLEPTELVLRTILG